MKEIKEEKKTKEEKMEFVKGKKKNLKTKKVVSKKELEKEKIEEIPKKEIDQSKSLKIIFFILLIIVILLCYRLSKMSKTEVKEKANIVIPIIEKDDINEFSIDVSDMQKGKELDYVVKLINYDGENINTSKIKYTMTITEIEDIKLDVTKIGEEQSIKEKEIKGEMKAKEKEEIYFKIHLTANKSMNESAQISIKIETTG